MIRLTFAILALLLTLATGACRKRNKVETSATSAVPPSEVRLPAPNPGLSPQQQAEESLGSMNEALRNYIAEKGKLPLSVADLYNGYAPKTLQPPPGRSFVLNPKTMGVEYR